MARSLNRVQLIGNLTRDPELRYTPTGTAVVSFSIATNRSWTTDSGEKKDEADFHRIVAWNKLAELCSQFLSKGKKVYVEGRLSTRSWTGQDGVQKSTTEVIISDMILLDSSGRRSESPAPSAPEEPRSASSGQAKAVSVDVSEESKEEKPKTKKSSKEAKKEKKAEEVPSEPARSSESEEVAPDDIPF
mgnify:CR=1